MYRSRESAIARSGRFDLARMGRAAALALGVVVVHAWLLHDGSRRAAAGATAPPPASLMVRQIPVNPPGGPAMALVPTLETPAAPAIGARRRVSRAAPAAQNGALYGEPAERPTESVPATGPPIDRAPAAADSAEVESRRSAAAESDAPPPVYATRVPPSTDLHYSLRRGTATGEARLSWRADADRYELQLHATLPSGATLEQRSQGGFDAAGLAPVRLADRRRGRDQRAANFQRERGLITFSGSRAEVPVVPGAQDRLTWLIQLAAIAAGAPQDLREGAEVAMLVVGARGAASLWRFQVQSMQAVSWSQGTSDALWLLREPQHPYDLRIEVWLDPARDFWPLRLRQTQIPGGEATEWQLLEEPRPGPGT
jgi:Protein of unknown function (DUF3108)